MAKQPQPQPPSADVSTFESPVLNDVQQQVADALREDGIAVVGFEDLLGRELWHAAVTDIEPFIRETTEATSDTGDRPAGKEEVIVRRFFDRAAGGATEGGRTPRFSIDDPWLRIAASPLLIDVVNSYQERGTRLFYLDNWFTVPYPNAEKRVASQRWHRDPEDEHVVKVFIYFSDVDGDAGPFEYIRSSAAGGRYGDLFPWGGRHRYPPPGELEAVIAPEDMLTMTGPAGTILFCDTGGFHRGGFARTKPRILSIATYLQGDRKRDKRRFEVDFAGRQASLPPQVLAALS
jgi:hypothetical protein